MATYYYSVLHLRSGLSKSRRHKEIAGAGGSDSHGRCSHASLLLSQPPVGEVAVTGYHGGKSTDMISK